MKAKLGILFVVAIMALAGVGAAYAHWMDTLTIQGTISTGTLDVDPSFHFDDLVQVEDKDVASVDHSICDDTVTVTITNAYPCLTVEGMFDAHGIGSIPAGLNSWTITAAGQTYVIYDGSANDVIDPSMTETQIETELEDWVFTTSGGAVTIEIDFDGSNFWQIHDGHNPTMDFDLHFEEALLQGQTFTFSMTLEYWNWNEAAATSP